MGYCLIWQVTYLLMFLPFNDKLENVIQAIITLNQTLTLTLTLVDSHPGHRRLQPES